MKKTSIQIDSNEVLLKHLLDMEEQLQRLENEMKKISGKMEIPEKKPKPLGPSPYSSAPDSYSTSSTNSNIIYFPGVKEKMGIVSSLFQAKPGEDLPMEIPDFRPDLQRDGLILLAWDWRITERGGLYTAYWVTSTSVPRYYASKALKMEDFFTARPDHKSYAAEDGIEFFGQDAPAYMVHVAPELMMSNPRHEEQRKVHIKLLKKLGSKLDFNYKYLLKTEKKRRAISGNNQAG